MNKFKSTSFVFVLVTLFGVGLWSCGSDDDSPSVTPAIVGTWVYESHTVNVSINGQNSLQFLVENMGLSEAEALMFQNIFLGQLEDASQFQGFSIQFRADGTFQLTDSEGVESGTYELRNNNTLLVLDDGEEVVELEVTELTNNFMTVVVEEGEEFDITDDGEDETIEIQFSLRFQKQN